MELALGVGSSHRRGETRRSVVGRPEGFFYSLILNIENLTPIILDTINPQLSEYQKYD